MSRESLDKWQERITGILDDMSKNENTISGNMQQLAKRIDANRKWIDTNREAINWHGSSLLALEDNLDEHCHDGNGEARYPDEHTDNILREHAHRLRAGEGHWLCCKCLHKWEEAVPYRGAVYCPKCGDRNGVKWIPDTPKPDEPDGMSHTDPPLKAVDQTTECNSKRVTPDEGEDLKPCPFCGGEAKSCTYAVFCTECDTELSGFDDVRIASKAWNTRTDDELVRLIEGLKGLLINEATKCIEKTREIEALASIRNRYRQALGEIIENENSDGVSNDIAVKAIYPSTE